MSVAHKSEAQKSAAENIASMVVAFVGVMSVVATATGGIIAYQGFKSISDIADKNNSTIREMKDRYDEMFKNSKVASAYIEARLAKLNQINNIQNEVIVTQVRGRIVEIINNIDLDELESDSDAMQEIARLTEHVAEMGKLEVAGDQRPSDVISLSKISVAKNDIVYLSQSLRYFCDKDFLRTSLDAQKISNVITPKYRILYAAYANLYQYYLRDRNLKEAYKVAVKELNAAHAYFDAELGHVDTRLVAFVNYAQALVDVGSEDSMTKASTIITEIVRAYPQDSEPYYIKAYWDLKNGRLDDALDDLQKAKTYGNLSTESQLADFRDDPRFDELGKISKSDPRYAKYNRLLSSM